ncbi:hypothetical protein B0H16DRAFT_1896069 [Mycena metata]|uniref:DUF5648 domain-containing protein n=1 Tax=Mycena metata TaxID=1033252 RepID=A0AAD7MLW4_9AGAR|nr:hypothetical protein B0H16DRAFT_1896069 [Mycena metata]
MTHIFSVIFISLAVFTLAFHAEEPGPDVRRSADTCGNPADALPFYRAYNPAGVDHFYTADVNVLLFSIGNYPLQEVAALVFVTQESSTVPFYRLYNSAATDNFYTTSTTEMDNALRNGYVNVTGDPFTYIYPTQVCGSVPFYRLYHETKLDNFYTTSETERLDFIANQGYTDIEIAGYVLPLALTQC